MVVPIGSSRGVCYRSACDEAVLVVIGVGGGAVGGEVAVLVVCIRGGRAGGGGGGGDGEEDGGPRVGVGDRRAHGVGARGVDGAARVPYLYLTVGDLPERRAGIRGRRAAAALDEIKDAPAVVGRRRDGFRHVVDVGRDEGGVAGAVGVGKAALLHAGVACDRGVLDGRRVVRRHK